mmetsp:Transcript_1985/g.2831  ORF Transcript_1985/g.2831 Transcript_1985/m.2831 type:complete len:188 (+) Transcript_1985:1141-1704(+)
MGGVDLADQHISYYHPSNIKCQRIWIPIFIQLLSIIRNNAFIIYQEHFGKKCESHKKFALGMISWLITQADKVVKDLGIDDIDTTSPSRKRIKSTSNAIKSSAIALLSELYPTKHLEPKELHVKTVFPSCGCCVYCSASITDRKRVGEALVYDKEMRRTKKYCAYCSIDLKGKMCFLCDKHFDEFHK